MMQDTRFSSDAIPSFALFWLCLFYCCSIHSVSAQQGNSGSGSGFGGGTGPPTLTAVNGVARQPFLLAAAGPNGGGGQVSNSGVDSAAIGKALNQAANTESAVLIQPFSASNFVSGSAMSSPPQIEQVVLNSFNIDQPAVVASQTNSQDLLFESLLNSPAINAQQPALQPQFAAAALNAALTLPSLPVGPVSVVAGDPNTLVDNLLDTGLLTAGTVAPPTIVTLPSANGPAAVLAVAPQSVAAPPTAKALITPRTDMKKLLAELFKPYFVYWPPTDLQYVPPVVYYGNVGNYANNYNAYGSPPASSNSYGGNYHHHGDDGYSDGYGTYGLVSPSVPFSYFGEIPLLFDDGEYNGYGGGRGGDSGYDEAGRRRRSGRISDAMR